MQVEDISLIELSSGEMDMFKEELISAVYRQLHANDFISGEQLIELLKLHDR